ncbi:carboxyl transferase domain-containing protein [Euzebya pacifica]|uniref:carboxyl transferase domain-containing protein n=1 Tax=Euzebya pacifica TaxID=1608957 RepID=UPI0030F97AC7
MRESSVVASAPGTAGAFCDWLVPGGHGLPSQPGSWSNNPLGWPGYEQQLQRSAAAADFDEAVTARHGQLFGTGPEVVALVWDFGFLGGSMGVRAGDRIVQAYDYARAQRLPIVLAPSTGGARMQEGMASLAQMVRTRAASAHHGEAKLAQVCVLRDPTCGGVLASHVASAHFTVALSGSRIALNGGRARGGRNGSPSASTHSDDLRLPPVVDRVVPVEEVRHVLEGWFACVGEVEPRSPTTGRTARVVRPPTSGWESIVAARSHERLTVPALEQALGDRVELRGDRSGADDDVVRTHVARHLGRPIVVVAVDRTTSPGTLSATGFRKAHRALELAGALDLPLVTLLDTAGTDAETSSGGAECAPLISSLIQRMLEAPVATVAVLVGEGGSGGGIPFVVADDVLACRTSAFPVIDPEAATGILKLDHDAVAQVAGWMRPSATDLWSLGIVDEVLDDRHGGDGAGDVWGQVVDRLARSAGPGSIQDRLVRWEGPPAGPGSRLRPVRPSTA